MAGPWDTWLAALKAAGKGGENYPQLTIDRGLPYSKILSFGVNMQGDAITASLRASPDAADPVLVSFSVSVGTFTNGSTEVTISLTKVQTSDPAILPVDSDADGEERLVFDMLRNDKRLIAGTIPIAGKVTNAS
jgi:hypothetical protein